MTESWEVGRALGPLRREVTPEKIRRYAEASGDFNPIHLDSEFARSTQFGGLVAHGMLLLGYLSALMTREFGEEWARAGRLKVRFKAPARPGDRLEVWGTVRKVEREAEAARVVCAVGCRSEAGEEMVTGEATVRVPARFGPGGDGGMAGTRE